MIFALIIFFNKSNNDQHVISCVKLEAHAIYCHLHSCVFSLCELLSTFPIVVVPLRMVCVLNGYRNLI